MISVTGGTIVILNGPAWPVYQVYEDGVVCVALVITVTVRLPFTGPFGCSVTVHGLFRRIGETHVVFT